MCGGETCSPITESSTACPQPEVLVRPWSVPAPGLSCPSSIGPRCLWQVLVFSLSVLTALLSEAEFRSSECGTDVLSALGLNYSIGLSASFQI